MEPRGRYCRRRLPGVPGHDVVDAETLVVPQQYRDFVVVFGGVEGNNAVTLGIVHVDDIESEAISDARQHQAGAVHWIGKTQEHG